jgi:hypothetical protein
MKKIFTIAATFFLLILTSCSDDSTSTATGSNAVLLQKIIEQNEDGSLLMTNYQYDGTKLTDITYSDGRRAEFTYNRDQIVKVAYSDTTAVARWETFVYDTEGRIDTMRVFTYNAEEPVAMKTAYTYNADGTVSLAMFSGNHESQTELAGEATVTTANGNVTGYTSAAGNSTYAFDAGNNAQLNTTGLAPLYIAWQNGGLNNITSTNHTNGTEGYSITYTYNSKDYPISAVKQVNSRSVQIWYLY